MDHLKVGDHLVLYDFPRLKFAVVCERKPKRVYAKIKIVPDGYHIDRKKSDPVTWTHICKPVWGWLSTEMALLNTKSGKVKEHPGMKFIEIFDPDKTYQYTTSCD